MLLFLILAPFYTSQTWRIKVLQRAALYKIIKGHLWEYEEGRLFSFRDIQEANYFDIDVFGANFSKPKAFQMG